MMPGFAKSAVPQNETVSFTAKLLVLIVVCICSIPHAHAAATLLLEEPYSYDGAFAGTGHSAVYLSNVCASSPLVLRSCAAGESGVVLSRYDGIAGNDWAATPLIPYLYAVESADSIPLFADPKLVAFLRNQYRQDHLQSIAPDSLDGSIPDGNWYEMVGASYDRTIYGFTIETTPEQDALLIEKFNRQPNRERYNFVRRNCADFVREIINFYYPHALHRSVIGDLGVTTPKQIAKMLAKYARRNPELQSSNFVIPQVPGAERRSKPVHGVLESVMAAKKYMLPLVALHPYIGGGLLVEYFGHRRFDPGRNALVLSAGGEMDMPMTRNQRLTYQSRFDELSLALAVDRAGESTEAKGKIKVKVNVNDAKVWERLQAGADPEFDALRHPVLETRVEENPTQVGLARCNILNASESPELAVKLLQARLRQELRPAMMRKTSPSNVEKDLALFRQLLLLQPAEVAATPVSSTVGSVHTRAGLQ